ncbi:hypothetical protein ABMA27_010538 [Loxostege sticticalis]|uniref:Integrase catalytic domain-containing protein n=1 Tax=Loxostege sticticalis TaxID=481309 RepID=A0ABR3H612_LOXSC
MTLEQDSSFSDSTVIMEQDSLKELIKRRGVEKGKLTLYKKYLSNLDPMSISAEQCLDLELRTDKMSKNFMEYEKIQDKIETISSEIDKELAERECFENSYYESIAKAKNYLNQKNGSLSSSNSIQVNNASQPFIPESDAIKYPDIFLPSFSGNITQWIEFRDSFDALVNQTNLKAIQKFKYLRGCLKDSALEVVSSLEYSEESYAIAWQLLCEHYNNPKVLVYNHLRAIININNVPTNANSLRNLADNIFKHMRTLKSLNISAENWDVLVIFLLSSKLEAQMQRKWEEKCNSRELPILQEFKFLALKTQSRIQTIKKLGLCLNCLGSNHVLPNCKASHCRTCQRKHHTLLHIIQNDTSQPNTTPRLSTMHTPEPIHTNVESQSVNLLTNQQIVNTTLGTLDNNIPIQHKTVVLSTAQITVLDNNNQLHTMRALLDSGSQSNYITESAYRKLNLPTQKLNMEVIGFNEGITKINRLCNLTINSIDNTYSTNLSCFIVPNICSLQSCLPNAQSFNIPKRFNLADISFYKRGEVDIIIGAELFYNLLCLGQHRLGDGLPILQRTRLGWVVSGCVPVVNKEQRVRCNFIQNSTILLSDWDQTESSHDDITECEKVFATHTRTSDGNFVVKIPLQEPKTTTEPCNYLPHNAVLNPQKSTTPLRVVIDASCKTSTGMSLNDLQHKGTMNQDNLDDILIRFRKHKYVICADIKQMYRNIFIHPTQQHLQCVFWRDSPHKPLKTYQLTTLSFGLKCAPYLATRCLKQLADENRESFPVASSVITSDFYMDDLIHGSYSDLELAETAVQIDNILRSANFILRKWKSNSQMVLNKVNNSTHTPTNNNELTSLGSGTHKVLGLAWSSDNDNIRYKLITEPVPTNLTKRKVLSTASAIFDPLGLLGPIIIIAKCFIQRLWKLKINWDETLPYEFCHEWQSFYNQLNSINLIAIPRNFLISNYIIAELHGFCDSSLTAYGAAIYVRSIDIDNNVVVRLLCAKSRVARNETIPKLELRACQSNFSYDKKHPIILPRHHRLTELIVVDFHKRLLHAGPQLLLSSLREQYWPVHGKQLVNKVVHKCVTCFRAKPKITTPIMGNLPPSRVNPTLPFVSTSVDYAGPFNIRDRRGQGYKASKCYIAVFVCSTTKAVHLQLVSSLETNNFLAAFKRFISRRGKPKEMLSDNGTTFHGADNELKNLYNFLSDNLDELTTSCASEGITWKYLSVYTPHMGGLHEAAVKSCKYHLKRVLGNSLLTFEEFSTVLTQVESILNSRPLCPITNSANDDCEPMVFCLTPAHFLIGRTPISIPDYDYTDVQMDRLTHYQQLQQLYQSFWQRWSRDYIGLLQTRTKWRSSKGESLRDGTIVLVKEDRLPPNQWKLGRIIKCCKGKDGVTRVAEIHTSSGVIKRAFNNICPLPINGSE